MSEIYQAYAYIVGAMKNDSALMAAATGGVWQGFAPLGTTAPYALVTKQSDSDSLTMNAVRIFAQILLQIKAVGPSSDFDTLETIAKRIDALFGRSGVTTPSTGGVVFSVYRDGEISYEEEPAPGVQVSHLGGLYHIEIQGT